jgi:hypothetical protein
MVIMVIRISRMPIRNHPSLSILLRSPSEDAREFRSSNTQETPRRVEKAKVSMSQTSVGGAVLESWDGLGMLGSGE